MRFIIFIISLFVFAPSFATKELPIFSNQSVYDGGGKKLRKKKNKKLIIDFSSFNKKTQKKTKGKAILMAILTGPLGGHRLYLGTKPYVPIVYALTLGGGFGLLPLIDIAVILLSKNTEKYYDNPQIIMW